MRTTTIAVMLSSLLIAPAYADVIPSRRAASRAGDACVGERLKSCGVRPTDAQGQSASLTPSELSYFAAHPERVRVVGRQEMEFDWGKSALLAGGILAGAILIWTVATNVEKNED